MTDSDGKDVKNVRFLKAAERKLQQLQRSLSKKKIRSSNRQKAKIKLGKEHLKVSRKREDFARKLARTLCVSNDIVFYEDLNISQLVKDNDLAKSINDAAWGQFFRWLKYYGSMKSTITMDVDSRNTSNLCARCDAYKKKSLKDRWHQCKNCNLYLHRDFNSALVILKRGIKKLQSTGGQPETSKMQHSILDKLRDLEPMGLVAKALSLKF